ncbi:MIF4G domain-containing protein, partial [Ophiophagus hannah]
MQEENFGLYLEKEVQQLLKIALKDPSSVDLEKVANIIVDQSLKDCVFSKEAGHICYVITPVESKQTGQQEYKGRDKLRAHSLQAWICYVTFICNIFDYLRVNNMPMMALEGLSSLSQLLLPEIIEFWATDWKMTEAAQKYYYTALRRSGERRASSALSPPICTLSSPGEGHVHPGGEDEDVGKPKEKFDGGDSWQLRGRPHLLRCVRDRPSRWQTEATALSLSEEDTRIRDFWKDPLHSQGKREAAVRESEEERRGRVTKKKENGRGKEMTIRGLQINRVGGQMKRKCEEHLRKVLQAQKQVEQLEEEKKNRLEQKLLAQDEEKNEKVQDEKIGNGKIKKRALAKKLEELEA